MPIPSSSPTPLLLTSLLLGKLLQRMRGVGAQSTLGLVRILLCVSLRGRAALVVDVVGGGAGLGTGLVLWLGGLTACVWGGHDESGSAS
jgi:hypothetical protein